MAEEKTLRRQQRKRFKTIFRELGEFKISPTDIPDAFLERSIADPTSPISFNEALALKQFAKAITTGDTKAAEFIVTMQGDKPALQIDSHTTTSTISTLTDDEIRTLLDQITPPSTSNDTEFTYASLSTPDTSN